MSFKYTIIHKDGSKSIIGKEPKLNIFWKIFMWWWSSGNKTPVDVSKDRPWERL